MADYFVWDFPESFSLGILTIRYYSLLFMLAFVISFQILKKIFKQERIDLLLLDNLFFWSFVATIFGARLGHVLFYDIQLFKEDLLSVFLPIQTIPNFRFTGYSGLASHGAAIAFLVLIFFFSKNILKKNFFWLADRIVIPISLAAFFIRVGNFFNSEIIGKPSNSNFAVIFKNQSLDYGPVVPRHPSQLYEAVFYLILFLILLLVYFRTSFKNYLGFTFGLFLTLLWFIRFMIEFTKESQHNEYINLVNLNTGQLLSLPLIIIGIYIICLSLQKRLGVN
jgi:prolipoprotein diacylglyceryl transferase